MNRPGSAPAQTAQVLVVTAGACLLAWLAFRGAVVRTLPADSPLLTSIAANPPDDVLDQAMVEAETGRPIDQRGYDAITRAAYARPLDARPFFLFALRALKAGQDQRGMALLEEARRRDPRLSIARLLLVDRWLHQGHVQQASEEMMVLARLLPAAADVLVAQLAHLAMDPSMSSATRAALTRDPVLLDRVLGAMAREGATPAALSRFSGPTGPAGLEEGGWRRILIDVLVARGDFSDARAVWADGFQITSAQRAALVFDSEFSGIAAGPPFGWTASANEVGATMIGKGELTVEFYSRRSGTLAEQLLVLPPGTYRFRVMVDGLEGDGSGLSWSLTCAETGANSLMSLPFPLNTPTTQTMEGRFTVPMSGCAAQWLRLVGTAGEFATPVSARLTGLSIEAQP